MGDVNLRILLQSVGGASVISSVQSIASSLGSGGLGGALLAVGAAAATAAVGIGVTAVKAAGTYQQSLTGLVTGAGESTKNLGAVSNGILKIANDTGTTTKQLTSGMFQIESSGQHGAAGLQVLANAARGAKVGNADLGVVSNATTTIMSDFGISAANSSVAVNTLVAVVSNGKTTMDQLSSSLSQILPTASAAGISLTDTGAAMATMTGEGVPAAQAATYLRQTILGIEAPSKSAATAMANVGLKSSDVAAEMKKSLPDALKMITDAVGKQFPAGSADYVNAIKNIAGGSKTMQGVIDLTGNHLATFNANVKNISSAVKSGGDSINGWSLVQQNFNQKMSEASEVVETLMIGIGQQLLPVVTQLADNALPVIANFSNWVVQSGVLKTGLSDLVGGITSLIDGISTVVTIGSNIISFFQNSQLATAGLMIAVGALGGVMALFAASSAADMILSLLEYGLSMLTAVSETVTGAATMTSTFGVMSGMIVTSMGEVAVSILATLGPFLLIGAGIALVVAGFILAYNHIKPFHDAVNNIAQLISSNFLPVLHSISGFIQQGVKDIENIVTKIVDWNQKTQPLHTALNSLGTAVKDVKGFVQDSIGVITNIVNWFIKWRTPILSVAGAITVFFLPALIKAGTEASIAGGKIAISFVQTMIKTGTEAVINGVKTTASFVASMVKSGTEAVINGAKVTASFVASMVKSGTEAVVNGVKVTASFVSSLIKAGLEGWQAAGKLATFVASLIASGAQAVINAAKITASFIASMVQAGLKAVIAGAQIVGSFVAGLITAAAQAVITGATFIASLVPAIISVIAQAVIAAATAIPGLVIGFGAWAIGAASAAIATLAAAAPILLIIAVIALLVIGIYLLVTHWKQVVGFLQGAWSAFVAWISPAIRKVGQVFTDVFNNIKTFLQNAWNFIVNAAKAGASLLLAVVIGPIGLLVIFVIQHWSQISAFISTIIAAIVVIVQTGWNNLSNNVRNIATGLWNNVTNIFNNAKSMLGDALHSVWDWLNGIMDGWPANALQAGIKVVDGIADGIRGAISHVTSAISDVTSAIGNFLPHSPAKEGELSHLNEYGPNLVKGFSSGIIQSLPLMSNALGLLTTPVGSALNSVSGSPSIGSSPSSIASSLAGNANSAGSGSSGQGYTVVNITITQMTSELHIVAPNMTNLTNTQIEQIVDQTLPQISLQLANELRAQFGNI